MVEQSSISVADTARNGLWTLIHTCSGMSVVGIIPTHQISAILQGPGVGA